MLPQKTKEAQPKKKALNPFLTSSSFKMMNKETRFRYTQNYTEGVTTITKEITDYEIIELDEFVKVYKFPRQLGFINALNGAGAKMYLYIQSKLPSDQDFILLKTSKVSKDLNVSVATVYNCIDNLIDAGVLCKKGNSEYWINPTILFNGNRKHYIMDNAPEKIEYIKDGKPTIEYDTPVIEGNIVTFNKLHRN